MPSPKNPVSTVVPGAGRLPASTVSASAFIFPGGGGPGGGSMAALQAHTTDPRDAHMAGAIGIPPTYPPTGEALLSSHVPPGVINGESVLDFIAQFKDLLPPRPSQLGYPGGVNSMIPSWGTLNGAAIGGYNDGASHTVYTRYVAASATVSFTITGTLYPADRGVLALYRKTDGDFTNPFSSATLMAALWLGPTNPAPPTPPPAGIPVASFDETLRATQQSNYTAAGGGLDRISLTYRYPYQTSYPAGVPYAHYETNFSSFQLATFSVPQPVGVGGNQDWFLVHWRSTFAVSLAAIQPGVLGLAHLVVANCYSAVPSTVADFDNPSTAVFTLNRHHVFRDALSGTVPTLGTLSSTLTANTHKTSGVSFYNRTGAVSVALTATLNNLFGNAFQLGSSLPIPVGYQDGDPVVLRLGAFGAADRPYRYDQLDNGSGPLFSLTHPPAVTDQGRLVEGALGLTCLPYTVNSFSTPYSVLTVSGFNLWADADFAEPKRYLWNSWSQTGNAGSEGGYNMATTEKFVDESYRYAITHAVSSTDPIKPVVSGVVYDSTAILVGGDQALQVLGSRLVYPRINFSGGLYAPPGPNYATVQGADPANYLRRYVRAFDTGIPRNVGRLRLRGLAAAAFQTNAAYDGLETTGHLVGGAILQVKIPGVTGWLDIGRPLGDPGLSTLDFYGCATGLTPLGGDIVVSFQTSSFTVNNGAGAYPLFVRVSFLNNAAGLVLSLDELEWQAP